MKKNPFKTPKHYFDQGFSFESKSKEKTQLNKAAFQIPENYFERFEIDINSEGSAKDKRQTKTIALWMYRVAAVLVLGLILSPLVTNNSTGLELSDEAYIDYFEEGGFVVLFDPEVLNQIDTDQSLDVMDFVEEIDSQSILNYIEDENIDFIAYTYYEE
jgi:hypothetical protein